MRPAYLLSIARESRKNSTKSCPPRQRTGRVVLKPSYAQGFMEFPETYASVACDSKRMLTIRMISLFLVPGHDAHPSYSEQPGRLAAAAGFSASAASLSIR